MGQLIDQFIDLTIRGLDLLLISCGLFPDALSLRFFRGCEILVKCPHGLDQCITLALGQCQGYPGARAGRVVSPPSAKEMIMLYWV